jgi:predicted dehydrogenase
MKKPAIAVIGYGYWGPNLFRNFFELQDRLDGLYCCDLSDARLAAVKARYPKVETTTRLSEVLNDPHIDACVIATPAKSHYEIARACLEKGKHVLVEKPAVLKVEEGLRLKELIDKKGLIYMAGHTFLYNPAVRLVKDYIDKKKLGKIYYIHSTRVNLGQIRRDVNALWNFGPHDISIILYLLGIAPKKVISFGRHFLQKQIEDLVFLNLDFSTHKVIAHIHMSWLDPSKIRRMTVVGNKKMLVYDDIDNESKIKLYDKGIKKDRQSLQRSETGYEAYQFKIHSGDIHLPQLKQTEPLRLECEHFIESVSKHTNPLTDINHVIQVTSVLEAAQKSLEHEGACVHVAS